MTPKRNKQTGTAQAPLPGPTKADLIAAIDKAVRHFQVWAGTFQSRTEQMQQELMALRSELRATEEALGRANSRLTDNSHRITLLENARV